MNYTARLIHNINTDYVSCRKILSTAYVVSVSDEIGIAQKFRSRSNLLNELVKKRLLRIRRLIF